jgi:UDP-N-acetylmuramoyl-L-alanyl-D-glutamate--2,6-diaminopimelate ligase
VVVDYAHTPDALESALRALRPETQGRLAVVFGAGGDRDAGKRPMMGSTAKAHADLVYVTDDNPRSEDAATIRAAIIETCPDAIEIADRGEAIAAAMRELNADDVLLIAGKGHENVQLVGSETLPFSDSSVARNAIRRLTADGDDG